MKKIIPMIFSIALMFGCSHTEKSSWNKNEIIDHRFELISTDSVEVFTFLDNGSAPSTVGTKGGALAGPIFSWELNDGQIQISYDKNINVTLEKRNSTDDLIHVLRNGESATYKVQKTN
jgi:hypothetical protein